MGDQGSVWLKVLDLDELPEGRVKPVTCKHRTLCLTHFEGEFAALDNKCPHQGGPLGEGSIESGLLRCPWHGWDFHPLTGDISADMDKIRDFYAGMTGFRPEKVGVIRLREEDVQELVQQDGSGAEELERLAGNL